MHKTLVAISALALSLTLFSCGSSNNQNSESKSDQTNSGVLAYKQQCSVCHGSNGNLMMAGAKDLTKSTMTDSEVEAIIRAGKGTMPEFASKMTDDEISETVKFVMSLRK